MHRIRFSYRKSKPAPRKSASEEQGFKANARALPARLALPGYGIMPLDETSRIRMPVGHSIDGIKRFRLMRRPYAGSAESLRFILNVVTGLANTNSLWDHAKDAPKQLLTKLMGRLKAGLASVAWT